MTPAPRTSTSAGPRQECHSAGPCSAPPPACAAGPPAPSAVAPDSSLWPLARNSPRAHVASSAPHPPRPAAAAVFALSPGTTTTHARAPLVTSLAAQKAETNERMN